MNKTTEALKLAEALENDAKEHREVSYGLDCPPERTANWKHALNCEDAARLIREALAEPVKRPQNCGTGYCSCIECPHEPVKHEVHQEPVAHKWPLMGYGNVSIGGCKQPDGTSGLIYLDMGETREIDADTTDLFPVGSKADPSKLLACIYFKDGSAIQQTIDVLREMQIETGYAAPVDAKAIRAEDYIKAYQQGRKDMKEEAAKVCDDIGFEDNGYGCAAAIRSME